MMRTYRTRGEVQRQQAYLIPLYKAGPALALLARQPCHDNEADAHPHCGKFLPAEGVRMHDDLYALRKCLVYNILQHALFACNIERRRPARSKGRGVWRLQGRRRRRRRRTQVDMVDQLGSVVREESGVTVIVIPWT